ncbi:MAG TPA: zinc-binding dehydrogenase, partial [Verrucomicrobiae bacterium]|nr:zinc-binding dehydrogenase [Verrucomicrobiae bacterium]
MFADRQGAARALAQKARALGMNCILIHAGQRFARRSDGEFEVAPGCDEDFDALLGELRAKAQWPPKLIVHMAGLDIAAASAHRSGSLCDEQEPVFSSMLQLLKCLARQDGGQTARLCLITHSATSAPARGTSIEPAQAPLGGLARVIALEYPELRCTQIDLPADWSSNPTVLESLCDEVLVPAHGEDRIALSGLARCVARLRPLELPVRRVTAQATPAKPDATCFALPAVGSGILDELRWEPFKRRPPGPGELEIEIVAAGLNFRDVLVALKAVAGYGERLGGECAGRVLAVGPGVKEFAMGDEVIAFAIGGMASHVTVSSQRVIHKPKGLSLEAAAGLPVIFLTALYAFTRVATVKQGQRVLIHAGAGGVGSAAVQLARRAGAEIFSTAGTPEKRALLKSWGVQHVFDSRSLAFADQIRSLAGERGLDIVLNSFSGEAGKRSLALVRAGGTFIELGKRDVMDAGQVAREYPGVNYVAFDLAEIGEHQPETIQDLFLEVKDLFETGAVEMPPTEVFSANQVSPAFRRMAQGQHTGKIVLRMKPEAGPTAERRWGGADGVWVITGGLGGLGLRLAAWLVDQGVKRLALIGRRPVDETRR